MWLSGGCQCSSRLVSDWHSRCNSSGWLGTAGYRDKQQALTQARPGQGGGAGIGTRGASLTSLWGAEGPILAGGPQTPAVKGLYLQMVQAVGPQVSQDDAGGISRHQHVVFVDMPPAVLPLSALPPVRHLKVDRRPHRGGRGPAVTPGHMLAPVLNRDPVFQTQRLSGEQLASGRGLRPILSLLVASHLTRGYPQLPHLGPLHCIRGGDP